MANEVYRELARRILAAVLSYRMGIKSVDYAMKEYVPTDDEIHPSWIDLADQIDRFTSESASSATAPMLKSQPTRFSDARKSGSG